MRRHLKSKSRRIDSLIGEVTKRALIRRYLHDKSASRRRHRTLLYPKRCRTLLDIKQSLLPYFRCFFLGGEGHLLFGRSGQNASLFIGVASRDILFALLPLGSASREFVRLCILKRWRHIIQLIQEPSDGLVRTGWIFLKETCFLGSALDCVALCLFWIRRLFCAAMSMFLDEVRF